MGNLSSFLSEYWAKQTAEHCAFLWQRGNCPYLMHLPEKLNWQDFHYLISQVANLLSSQVAFSDVQAVAYCGSYKMLGLLCYCAMIAKGKPILILNPALTEAQREKILAENGIDFLITDQIFAKFEKNQTACTLPLIDVSQPATLTLTSGSSGSPKAVVHSVQNHLANAEGVCELMQFEQEDSWLLSLPLFHVSGQGIIWRWLLKGATLFIGEEKSDFFEMMAQVSHVSLVPTQLQRYLAQNNLSTNLVVKDRQKCLLGGSAIPEKLVEQARQSGMDCFSGYGMTEMASTICAVENELTNVGKPLKGRAVKIVQQEIWVKGSSLGLGYWQKNGKIRPLVNSQGWLQTKDCGVWNAQGKLVVKGRMDNMFISGGENIQPEEVERILFQSGLVKQIFIVPVRDAEFGERPVALVDFVEFFSLQAVEKLKLFAISHLEKFKQPIRYLPLDAEKYQQSGIKISRQQLKQHLANVQG